MEYFAAVENYTTAKMALVHPGALQAVAFYCTHRVIISRWNVQQKEPS